jgi:phenylalanyl-tRNA synthetase beta chain
MNLAQILSDHPKGRDYAWTLEDAKAYPLITDSRGDVLSFPPIINGELTRVTEDTTDLFIDVTGTDEKAINLALNILVHAFADMGGCIYSVDIKTPSTRGA